MHTGQGQGCTPVGHALRALPAPDMLDMASCCTCFFWAAHTRITIRLFAGLAMALRPPHGGNGETLASSVRVEFKHLPP